MNKEQLEGFAREAAKTIKSESDLNDFRIILTKVTVETALNAELDEHLGYGKHQSSDADNSRNGYTSKHLKNEDGQFELTLRAIATAVLSLSSSRKNKLVSPRRTIKSSVSTPRA